MSIAGRTFDPYHLWLGIPPAEQPPDHYRLLGVPRFESNADVIANATDRQMGHVRTFQMGKHAALSQKILNEIAAARVCLLNAEKKAAYDASLRERVAAAPAGPPSPPPEAADGSVFGQYLLLDQLHNSRTGPIFRAKHRAMDRVVALKVFSPEMTGSAELVERFHRKMKILAHLSHPNLVAAHDAGEHDGIHYLVMEFIDGRDLWTLVKQHGPLPIAHAVSYTAQAAAGLGFAHAHGVFHRNVKPGNLLVDKQGVVKVIGLGLAGIKGDTGLAGASPGQELTLPGRVMGTYDYMAPEQAIDSHAADHRADIYGLGCTLHVLLTGRTPYPGKSPPVQVLAHRSQPIPSLRAARRDAPAGLDAVFSRMLAKKPEDRYPSMAEVIMALQTL